MNEALQWHKPEFWVIGYAATRSSELLLREIPTGWVAAINFVP